MSKLPTDDPIATTTDSKNGVVATFSNLALNRWREHVGNKVVRFDELAKCGDEIWIEHAGQLYRLRKTRHEKLVLSK